MGALPHEQEAAAGHGGGDGAERVDHPPHALLAVEPPYVETDRGICGQPEPPAPAADIAGRAARTSLRAGQGLRASDLMKPEVVKKNEMVLLHYEVPGIVLTMRGQALESGTEGDMVNVLNIQSKRTIQGVIMGAGRITIPGPVTTRLTTASTTE